MRSAGILMHISSLPSPYGIGTLGREAYRFVDFLKKAGQTYWQVLPVCPTSYGDSPYQSNSAFAGNPYFIDLDMLCEDGLLEKNEIENYFFGDNPVSVDYKRLFDNRYPVLRKAFSRFEKTEEYYRFLDENSFWIEDYALFMTVKEHHHFRCWLYWDEDIRICTHEAEAYYREKYARNIEFYKFIQYMFYKQWGMLKKYANENGIKIIGDMPIYVALDSAEVWRTPELFELDENRLPTRVAGCPPDAFSDKGQLWGNPLYNWERIEEQGFDWWIKRIRSSFNLYDRVRIDHFRGFEAYYAIPYGREEATIGEWVKGPGMKLFNAVKSALGEVDIIAEDLGFLTEDVHRLLRESGYPGMRVLQFAFNPYEDNLYLPHNYSRNAVAYTGTHDNDTFIGWYSSVKGAEREFAGEYLNVKRKQDAAYAAIRSVMASSADTVVIPIQDYLNKGSEARMNTPSTLGGNWMYRIEGNDIDENLAERIRKITHAFRRI
ncbi:MAG: 4-alpha-glucanotransferase [Eubacteriales bacterium]|nr:4-alpha-glucanotransferase [Eubacteriales bacterium]